MLTAITRAVGPEIERCALSFIVRDPIDPLLAAAQHDGYVSLLQRLGVRVVSLPPLPGAPDAPFVEDTAVVLPEVAVMTVPALPSRQVEVRSVAVALARYRPLEWLTGAVRLEGGDVLRVDRSIYVGRSRRTNGEGAAQLEAAVTRHGYTVVPVEVDRCLHLKTACTHVGRGSILANPAWVDISPFSGFDVIEADPAEPFGGNALLVGEMVIMPASAPRTAASLRDRGFTVMSVDISELEKAEAGLTCCSLLFATGQTVLGEG